LGIEFRNEYLRHSLLHICTRMRVATLYSITFGMHMHVKRLMRWIKFPQLSNRWQTTTDREQFYASFQMDSTWLRCGFPRQRFPENWL